jgi:hypothetical protein
VAGAGHAEVAHAEPPPSAAKNNPLPQPASKSGNAAAKSDPPPSAAPNDLSPVSTPAVKKDEPAKDRPATNAKVTLTAAAIAKLQKQVQEACPDVKNIKFEITPTHKLQVELTVRSDEQIAVVAGKLYSMPELMPYVDELELHFSVNK